jgi:two-component sensor histidine kinase
MFELYRERLSATPAAVRLARHGVSDALVRAGIADAALLADIALTVSEATTNAVRHAYPDGSDGHVDVTVARTAESIIITVRDEGGGMNEALPETRGLGVGLALMYSQTERLEIESDSAGTVVTLHFTAPAAERHRPQ